MSKMDRMLNSKREQETIYEIYRACRLCGGGAGYKMPIIQNVVDLDDTDVELKQKIRECVQIEVHQDDKMPPLICELCVDKVNDFYEFLEMCRQTNKKTRLRLGLPPQSMPRGAPDAAECILGVTEPVYVNDDSDGDAEPLAKHKKPNNKVKVKKEPELRVKLENKPLIEKRFSDKRFSEKRSMRFKSRERTPPRTTRFGKQNLKEEVQDKTTRSSSKTSPKTTPKPILKKEQKTEDTSLLTPRLKRSRDKEPVKLETPNKKVKIAIKPLTSTPKSSSSSSPKSSPKITPKSTPKSPRPSPKRPPSPPRVHKCNICDFTSKNAQGLPNHLRSHVVTFTSPRLACNPCGLWFSTSEEATSHHRSHKSKFNPYTCRRCTADFVHLSAYDDHFVNKQCLPSEEVPDVKCDVCWRLFATNNLLDNHRCYGEDNRPGGKCNKCNRSYALLKNLKKHESTCTARKRGELIVDPELLAKLRPIQVRVSRCDPLLTNIKQEHYDVSNVMPDFGLDKNCFYPYISSVSSLRIKTEFDGMVSIKDEVKDEFCSEEYVHWDSDSESDSEEVSSQDMTDSLTPSKKKKVDSLATLTLKTLFSPKYLGRVPRKRRKVKMEKNLFDSMLNETEDDVTRDINNIIDNLANDDDFDDDGKASQGGSDSILKDGEKNDQDSLKDVSFVDDDGTNEKIDGTSEKIDGTDEKIDGTSKKIDESSEAATKKDEGNEVASKDTNKHDINDATTDKNDANDEGVEKNDVVDAGADKGDVASEVAEKIDTAVDESVVKNDGNDQGDYQNDKTDDLAVKNDGNSDVTVAIMNATEQKEQTDGSLSENVEESEKNIISEGANGVCVEKDLEFKGKTVSNEISAYSNDEKDNLNVKAVKNGSILNKTDNSNNISTTLDNKGNRDDDIENKDETSSKNDDQVDDLNSQDSNYLHESLLNENTQNSEGVNGENVKEGFNHETKDNAIPETDINNEKAQADESMDNLSQNSKNSEEIKSLNSQEENEKAKRSTEDDIDDSKLMEALDAEIGESNDSAQIKNVTDNDKIALEDLISSKSHEKMDIDIIPDEFNFDN